MLLGMVALLVGRVMVRQLRPLILKYLVPTHDSKKDPISKDERLEIAQKIEGHLVDFCVYAGSAVWGLSISLDQEWMPWFLGGHGDFAKGFVNIPFLKVDHSVLYYGIF